MDATAFIRALAALLPSREELASLGYAAEETALFAHHYVIEPRAAALPVAGVGAIADVIRSFASEAIEIGPVQFGDALEHLDGYDAFGTFDQRTLAVARDSGRVVVLGDSGVEMECARSPEAFLDALAAAYRFHTRRLFDPALDAEPTVAKCTKLAGGSAFERFCRELVGEE